MAGDTHDLTAVLAREHERFLDERSGEVHDVRLDQDRGAGLFGLATMSIDGRLSRAGDADVPFAIQSVVKPWIYALALLDHGDEVLESVGVEPTGAPFDALVLEEETGRPPNPMVNAGALMAASLVSGRDADERVERIVDTCSRAAGRDLAVDDEVAAHEIEHGHRNRALGHLMRDGDLLRCGVDDAVEVLARACAISITTVDLATMGATLAGWGSRPGSSEQVLPRHVATDVVSVMATCGMYDGSGRWLHRAGLPAKSGVDGALMAVAPGRLGIGSYSPALDDRGNSVRGLLVGERLSEVLHLHPYGPPD
ncbi:glutaminase [Nocardioides cavernae]|uniref:Glutaminase n=1 Tax=Nocardioides cavernae TaxID=1921566 RepID=A0A7Y9H471_9ACTN|nr:glutaminase A [Nocardioides cavernae]NYE37652.1 glutaminase [Nocardioides cavernae]